MHSNYYQYRIEKELKGNLVFGRGFLVQFIKFFKERRDNLGDKRL